MKKVGLLTLPLVDNYGGILQAVALYGCLQRIGCDVTLIQKEFYQPAWKRLMIALLERIPGQNLRKFRSRYKNSPLHSAFIEEMLRARSRRVVTTDDLAALSRELGFDAVVVGSDQVWRLEYIDKVFWGAYFLNFLSGTNIRKISYAASFGLDHWEAPELSSQVSGLLADFDGVSVREASGKVLCRQFGRMDAVHVLDPTLLAGRAFYERITERVPQGDDALLYYVLDETEFSEAVLHEVQSVRGGRVSRIYDQGSALQTKTVPQWVRAFADAEFVVTDSFHGMVFSVLFNKPFVAIANHGRGASRFISLLERLGLKDRLLVSNDIRAVKPVVKQDIDYAQVNLELEQWRVDSEQFLKSALGVI